MKKEILKNNIFCLTDESHRFTTDALIIAALAPSSDIACDLCSGNGIITFLLKAEKKAKKIFSVENSKKACDLISEAVSMQNADDICVVCDDARKFADRHLGEFFVVTMNPPYYKVGSGLYPEDEEVARQKFEICGTLKELIFAASKLVRNGGHIVFSVKPERAAEAAQYASEYGLSVKNRYTVFHDEKSKPFLFVFLLFKGKCECTEKEIFLMQNGEYTRFYKKCLKQRYKNEQAICCRNADRQSR